MAQHVERNFRQRWFAVRLQAWSRCESEGPRNEQSDGRGGRKNGDGPGVSGAVSAHCGQAVGERSAANREISHAANATSRGRQPNYDSGDGSVKVSRSDLTRIR